MSPRALSPDIRLADCEAAHSVPFRAQVKDDSCYISIPPFVPPRHAKRQLHLLEP